jgi:hypothetical protein
MGVRVGFGHSVRSAQIATEKRKGKIGFILAINESKRKNCRTMRRWTGRVLIVAKPLSLWYKIYDSDAFMEFPAI